MKKWMAAAAALLALCCTPAFAQTGMVTLSASHMVDSSGNAISNATISFAPVNSLGQPISYRIDGKGQSIDRAVTAQVASGTFSLQIADTSLTSPVNVCFEVTVTDNTSGASLLGSGYTCVQPAYSNTWCSAGSCNFDNYTPSSTAGSPAIAPTLQIGTVGTVASGGQATASVSGSAPNYKLNLGIPAGPLPTLQVGTTTALAPGSTPTVSLAGSNPYSINFGIPNSGSGIPGGTNGQIQYNNNGFLAGASPVQIGSALRDSSGNYLISDADPAGGFPLASSLSEMLMWGDGAGANLGNWTPVVTTGTASSGSTALTVASATGIYQYMNVSGAGIATGTMVASISGTTVTLSTATTAAVSGTVTFTPGNTQGSVAIGWNALNSMVAGNGMVAVGSGAFQNFISDYTGGEDGNSVAIGPFAGYGQTGANCSYGQLFESIFIGNKANGSGCGATDAQMIGNHSYNFYNISNSALIGGEDGANSTGVIMQLNRVQAIGDGEFDPARSGNGTVTAGTYSAASENIFGSTSGQNLYNTHDNNVFGTRSFDDIGATSPSTAIQNDVIGNNVADGCSSCSYNVIIGNADDHGANAAASLTTGMGNVLIGAGAGWLSTTVAGSTIVGFRAAQKETTNAIAAFGDFAGQNATGPENLFVGTFAGANVTSGNSNTILQSAMNTGTGPSGSVDADTLVGAYAGYGDNTSNNTYVGVNAGRRNAPSLGTNEAFGYAEFLAVSGATGTEQYDVFFGDDSNCAGCAQSISLGHNANLGAVTGAVQIGPGTNSTSNTMQFQGWNFLLNTGASQFLTTDLSGATPTVASGHIGLGDSTATTATAGSATLPTAPVGFLEINIGGTMVKVPYYAN